VHHEHGGKETEREVTVILVQYASPLAAAMLPRQINAKSELQAASPAYETARLFRIVGVGVEALRAFALLLVLAAGFSVFIALYGALEERRYDLAVMRALGASRARLFGLLVAEGAVLAAAGALLGIALGHLLTLALGAWLEMQGQHPVDGLQFRVEELWVFAAALGIGIIAALLPAWRGCRADVSRTLAQG
jgi:putative ABC transport system permease protein